MISAMVSGGIIGLVVGFCLGMFIMAGRPRLRKTPKLKDINVIHGNVLPTIEDPRWAMNRTNQLELDGVSIWASETIPSLKIHGVMVESDDKTDNYCRTVLRSYRQRLTTEIALKR